MFTRPVGLSELRPVFAHGWFTTRIVLHRVYTGEQMWEKVLDAGIEDALNAVRLGDSLELGGFLGYDLLKGRDPTSAFLAQAV